MTYKNLCNKRTEYEYYETDCNLIKNKNIIQGNKTTQTSYFENGNKKIHGELVNCCNKNK